MRIPNFSPSPPTYLHLRHKFDESGVEGPEVEDGAGPHRLQEAKGGAGARLRPSVPVVEQAPGYDAQVVLVAVAAVVTPREGADLPRPKDGANGLGAVDTAPVLCHS